MSRVDTMTPIELLYRLAVCCTEERILPSQVAVLTFIACNPGCSSGTIANATGLSMPSVGRLLGYLIGAGDVDVRKVTAKRWRNKRRSEAPVRQRRFWLTPQGVETVKRLVHHLRWDYFGSVVVQVKPARKNNNEFAISYEESDGETEGFLPGLF